MNEMRYISPTGMIGSGFQEASLRRVLEADPHFIGCDGGSTDDGPYQLGAGKPMFARQACKRDLRILIGAALEKKIPLLVGSCGGAGGRINLEWTWDIVQEIAREESFHYKAAVIDAEPPRDYLLKKFREGRIKPLDPAPPLDEKTLAQADHVVCMMGVEPFQEAVDNGAQIVLAGRSSDTSIFAALPVKHGFDPGLAWHAAKVLECGAAAVTNRFTPDGMLCTLRKDEFILEPANPQMKCTPVSVAAHTLYENADPFLLYEPSGALETQNATYEAVDERRVRVRGSGFRKLPYTLKLEGAKQAGYQSIVIGGVRDPVILGQLDDWLTSMKKRITERIDSIFGQDMKGKYHMNLRVYGRDGVMGAREPERGRVAHEICLLLDFLADDPETAHTMAASGGHIALHHPVPEWHGLISGVAFPYAPHVIDRGAVYRFVLNHVVEPASPMEPFRIDYRRL
ncbi:MAG: acyclic terpene utilization AtuA family protein [Betaproteobacteria bacterium]